MADLIVLQGNVGSNADNLPADVLQIGAALIAIGPQRGGVLTVPLSIEALAAAIKNFQIFHKFAIRDGKVDKSGNTIKKINQLLNPGAAPGPNIPRVRTGSLLPIKPPGTSDKVEATVWTPQEQSFFTDMVFQWTTASGKGRVFYFELDEDVVPNWFGILVPDGLTAFDNIHIFFHPTPGQVEGNPYKDAAYQAKTNWSGIFHYLSDSFASQFCAANTNQVLVMPLMTESTHETCGIFPKRWESIVGRILGQIQFGDPSAAAIGISSVVVSSFSSGISYSAAFRSGAGLGGRLRGIIDLDGMYSTYRAKSIALPPRAVRVWQAYPGGSIASLAARNTFPVHLPRWRGGGPYKNAHLTGGQLHGAIPQQMMLIASRRAVTS